MNTSSNPVPNPNPVWWVLRLNDMRSSNIEILTAVLRAKTKGELVEFVESQRVAEYHEPQEVPQTMAARMARPSQVRGPWQKCFRKGGPLEWYNAPYRSDEDLHFFAVEALDAIIERQIAHVREQMTKQLTDDYQKRILDVPMVPGA